MQVNASSRPYDILFELDHKSKKRSGGMPSYQQQGENWTGVLFTVGEDKLLLSMSIVQEIVLVSRFVTSIPGTPKWIYGLVNLRGSLLTVIDLQGLISGSAVISNDNQQRILVINFEGFELGLLVSSVTGMKHFLKSDAAVELPSLSKDIGLYVHESFQSFDDHYAVLDAGQLFNDEKFQNILTNE